MSKAQAGRRPPEITSARVKAWARAVIPAAEATDRLNATKDLSLQKITASSNDVSALRRASAGEAALSLAGPPVQPPYTATVTKALALAALAALGQAGDEKMTQVSALLNEDDVTFCLNLAKLDFFQCLAGGHERFDDLFCIGEHAMTETGRCIVKAAGSPTPAFIEPVLPPRPEPKTKATPKAAPKAVPKAAPAAR